jgi:hypothetical protein
MSDNTTAGFSLEDQAPSGTQRDTRDEVVLRISKAAWVIGAIAFAVGILVGFALD